MKINSEISVECISSLPSPEVGNIYNICSERDRAITMVNQAVDLLYEAKKVIPPSTIENELRSISWHSNDIERNKERLRKKVDAAIWKVLLEDSKLGALLNTEQLKSIKEDISNNAPAVKYENVITTFMNLFERRKETFLEGFVSVFKGLSGSYKSHNGFSVGHRLILAKAIEGNGWRCFSNGEQIFKDFNQYSIILRGEDPTSYDLRECRATKIIEAVRNGVHELEFPDYKVKAFKCGNIHIFPSKELVSKINGILTVYFSGQLGYDKKSKHRK